MSHQCDSYCTCLFHGTQMVYAELFDDHACINPECVLAQGVQTYFEQELLTNLNRRFFNVMRARQAITKFVPESGAMSPRLQFSFSYYRAMKEIDNYFNEPLRTHYFPVDELPRFLHRVGLKLTPAEIDGLKKYYQERVGVAAKKKPTIKPFDKPQKANPNKPICRLCSRDRVPGSPPVVVMEWDTETHVWRCPNDCGMTARPKRTDDDAKQVVMGSGKTTARVIRKSGGELSIILVSDDNVCLDITGLVSEMSQETESIDTSTLGGPPSAIPGLQEFTLTLRVEVTETR